MSSVARREPKRVRSARRRAAHHADRFRKASTPDQRFKAIEDALVSAVVHGSRAAKTARELHGEISDHVRRVLDRAEVGELSRAHYEAKLASGRTDVQRLATALMCLRGAIARLADAERDRLFEHYSQHFSTEIQRITHLGGER